MKAISLGTNEVVYARNQEQYIELPAVKKKDGTILICWTLTFRERLRILFSGRLYHQVLTFNQKLQPILMSTEFPKEWETML